MDNTARPQVNQRLYFAALHLDTQERLVAEQQLPRRVIEQAFGESIVMHLVLAYRHYLGELAEAYAVTCSAPQRAADLQQAISAAGKAAAECQELAALEQPGHWLHTLQQAFAALGTVPTSAAAVPRSGDTIPLQPVAGALPDTQQLRQLYTELQAVIDNQRTRLQEW